MKFLCAVLLSLVMTLSVSAADANSQADQDTKIVNEALAAIQAGKFELAIEKADLVIKRFEEGKESDSDYVCTNGMSDTLAAMVGAAGQLDKGKATKAKTSAISSNICDAYFFKGFALIDLKRRDEALPYFEMAISLDPDNQHYINELGEWYKSGKQWQKSLEIFTQASETSDLSIVLMEDKAASKRMANSRQCRSYRGIAFSHVELGNWDKAREAAKKCLKLIPDDVKSLEELEYIKKQTGS